MSKTQKLAKDLRQAIKIHSNIKTDAEKGQKVSDIHVYNMMNKVFLRINECYRKYGAKCCAVLQDKKNSKKRNA